MVCVLQSKLPRSTAALPLYCTPFFSPLKPNAFSSLLLPRHSRLRLAACNSSGYVSYRFLHFLRCVCSAVVRERKCRLLFVCIIVFRLCVWFDVQPVAQKRHYRMKQKQYHRQSGPLGVHSELGPVCPPYQNKANLFLFASSDVPRLTLTSSTSMPRLSGKERKKRRRERERGESTQSLGEGERERGYIPRISRGSHLGHTIIIIVQRT